MCNAPRTPFAAETLNLAGKPARIGAAVARVFGWGALVVGLLFALTLGLAVQALVSLFFPATWIGWAVAIPIALLSLGAGLLGILGGRSLGRSGEASLQRAQFHAIRALVLHHNHVLRPATVARALNIPEPQADAILTELAKRPEENVSVDFDENGNIFYVFGSTDAIRWRIKSEDAGRREVLEAELEQAEAEAKMDPGAEEKYRRAP